MQTGIPKAVEMRNLIFVDGNILQTKIQSVG
jgi:hypothetical protein